MTGEKSMICPFGYYDDLRQYEQSVKGRDFDLKRCKGFIGSKAELYKHLAEEHQESILPVLLVQLVKCGIPDSRKYDPSNPGQGSHP